MLFSLDYPAVDLFMGWGIRKMTQVITVGSHIFTSVLVPDSSVGVLVYGERVCIIWVKIIFIMQERSKGKVYDFIQP